ncbi:MAG: polyphosphate kinase 1 [Chitinophagaceae bacterium]
MNTFIKWIFQLRVFRSGSTPLHVSEQGVRRPVEKAFFPNSILTDNNLSTDGHLSGQPVSQPVDLAYFDRDLSWLSFNERVLMEAERDTVPLLERLSFLSIYSSNLDEFYRVRIPALLALQKLAAKKEAIQGAQTSVHSIVLAANERIKKQLERFGNIIRHLIPKLSEHGAYLLYGDLLPVAIMPQLSDYFFCNVLAFLQPVYLRSSKKIFFPVNNQLYLAVFTEGAADTAEIIIINIPTAHLPRFYNVMQDDHQYIVFLEDIIRAHLPQVLKPAVLTGSFNFKVTRDAEISLEDEFEGDVADKIERQIAKRDFGYATRFLYQQGFPAHSLHLIIERLGLQEAITVEGGPYHNLKDLNGVNIFNPALKYPGWPAIRVNQFQCLLDYVVARDILLHTPYQSYDTVLRFFNEAAIDSDVTEIYTTMYRLASDSRIGNALISASANGKSVKVFMELKARFDEANNLKWAKKFKANGISVVYSENSLKVHAKIALVKRTGSSGIYRLGLLATGNLNENTSRFYTDHVLLTAHKEMLEEVEQIFLLLNKKQVKDAANKFNHLLVAQYNLQTRFIDLIEREITNQKSGLPAEITIKVNNLEEKLLINKLYEASRAGVKVNLIVRSICCIVPGVKGMSDHISVTRIVDRYLEHGRIFIFHNNGNEEVFMGSADWMNRNIYRRIEVCFPVYDHQYKKDLLHMVRLQLSDNVQGVNIDHNLNNTVRADGSSPVRSQESIYQFLAAKRSIDLCIRPA